MAERPKEKMTMDLDFSGLGPKEKPKFVKALIALGLPMRTLGLDLSWGTRPKFGEGRGVCIGLAHEDFGLRFELKPRPIRVDGRPHVLFTHLKLAHAHSKPIPTSS